MYNFNVTDLKDGFVTFMCSCKEGKEVWKTFETTIVLPQFPAQGEICMKRRVQQIHWCLIFIYFIFNHGKTLSLEISGLV